MMNIFEKKKKLVASILIVAMMFGTVSQGVLADGNSISSSRTSPVDGHYVTVTGVIEDKIGEKTYLEISSWGKKYYIDTEEYFHSVDKYSNYVFSNIMYIK